MTHAATAHSVRTIACRKKNMLETRCYAKVQGGDARSLRPVRGSIFEVAARRGRPRIVACFVQARQWGAKWARQAFRIPRNHPLTLLLRLGFRRSSTIGDFMKTEVEISETPCRMKPQIRVAGIFAHERSARGRGPCPCGGGSEGHSHRVSGRQGSRTVLLVWLHGVASRVRLDFYFSLGVVLHWLHASHDTK